MTLEKAKYYLSEYSSKQLESLMDGSRPRTSNVLEYAELVLFGKVSYWNSVDKSSLFMVIMDLNNCVEHPYSDSSDDD